MRLAHAMRGAAADARALTRRPLATLYGITARSSPAMGELLLRLVADVALSPVAPENTTMENNPESSTLNTKLKELGEEVAEELKRYQEKRPHTFAGKAINLAKGIIGKVKGFFGPREGSISAQALAEAGYNAYGARAGWKIHDGSKDMPTWGQLGAEVQARWCAAAEEMGRKLGVTLSK